MVVKTRDDFDRYYRLTDDPPEMQGRYTLHIDFVAPNEQHSVYLAEMYARGLNFLRLEVECYGARVSPAGAWSDAVEVFCMSPGPHPMDVCTDISGHPGNHNGPGPTCSWTELDIPEAPDTIEGAL